MRRLAGLGGAAHLCGIGGRTAVLIGRVTHVRLLSWRPQPGLHRWLQPLVLVLVSPSGMEAPAGSSGLPREAEGGGEKPGQGAGQGHGLG